MAIIKQKLKQSIASAIYSEIESKQARYYYYLGRIIDFANSDEAPQSSIDYESKVRNDMVLMKTITAADVSLVVPRVNWSYNRVFDAYNVTSDEGNQNTYCLVAGTYNVYKCLVKGVGTLTNPGSIYQPTTTDLDPQTMPDGYVWKFLFNVQLSMRNKFLTGEYIPVATALNSRFFSNGSIDNVSISSAGTGYVQSGTSITVSGDGIGAELVPNISGGQLTSVTIVNAGEGYTNASLIINTTSPLVSIGAAASINLTTGDFTSSQAVVEMLAVPGTIQNIIISDGGTGYSGVSVSIVGDGVDCTVTHTMSISGGIASITVTNPGKNYTNATVNITGTIATGGRAAVAYANISPPLGHGRDASAELYASAMMFYGNLSRETYGNVRINNDYRQYGIIRSPRNTAFGTNITDPISSNAYSVVAQFISGATINNFPVGTILQDSASNLIKLKSSVSSQTAFGFNLVSVSGSVITAGLALSSTNLYRLTGAWSTASFPVGTVLAKNSAPNTPFATVYAVTSTTMDVFTLTGAAVTNGQILQTIEQPTPVSLTVVTSTVTIKSFSVLTSQRKEYVDSTIASTCYSVSGNFDISLYTTDSVLTLGQKTFRVVSTDTIESGERYMLLLPMNSGKILVGDVLNIQNSATSCAVTSVLAPNVDKNTGDLLFIDNRSPFVQTPDQTVSFRTVFQF